MIGLWLIKCQNSIYEKIGLLQILSWESLKHLLYLYTQNLIFFLECLAKLIMTDTFKSWLEIILFIYFVHFVATWSQRLPEVSGFNPHQDLNPQPSDLQPDAMTIRPHQNL